MLKILIAISIFVFTNTNYNLKYPIKKWCLDSLEGYLQCSEVGGNSKLRSPNVQTQLCINMKLILL